MIFIFPQNYNFRNKLLGIFDYSTIILNLIWDFLIFYFINFFNLNINIKIFIFILFCFPLLIFSIVGFNGENIIYVLHYFLKFIIKNKLLFFDKK